MTQLNHTQAEYPRHTPLHELIDQRSVQWPDNIALLTTAQTLTYRQLNETANQLAHFFIQQGIRPGDIVGVALDRSPELLPVLLGIMKVGAAYLPIDVTYPLMRIQFMLTDSAARFLVTTKTYQGRAANRATELLIDDVVPTLASYSKNTPPKAISGADLVYVLYTSGSTGQPKGVLVKHHNLVNLLWSMISRPGITETDRLLAVTTVSFDIAALELFLPLLVGATLVLADTADTRDGNRLLEIIQQKQITLMQATPITYKLMLAAGWQQRVPVKILCCGEPMTNELANQLIVRCETLWNMYGPTETTIYSTGKQIKSTDEIITIGRPINNTRVYILDEYHNPVADGLPGQIAIAGDGVARGYLNRPELTREKFITAPFEPGLLYCTGDLGMITAEADVQYLGRIDQQIKIRGYRVETGEIEHALLSQLGIREAVVVAQKDRTETSRLVAYIVTDSLLPEAAFSAESVKWKIDLKKRLPDYMVPTKFLRLDQLPVTLNGKVDRQLLSRGLEANSLTGLLTASGRTESITQPGWANFGNKFWQRIVATLTGVNRNQ